MSAIGSPAKTLPRRVDKLGALVASIALGGLYLQPFALLRANRIVAPHPQALWNSLPTFEATAVAVALTLAIFALLFCARIPVRLGIAVGAALLLGIEAGRAGAHLLPAANTFARVSPGAGFWLLLCAFLIALADGLVRLGLSPYARLGALAVSCAAVGLFLAFGVWNDLSMLREYHNQAETFWREFRTHVALAGGSLAAAAAVGIPLGIVCYRVERIRPSLLNTLKVIQTVPSIALFGLLMAPLAWIAASVPGARALGVAGIGSAPAFIALFAYALLPIVANTAAGLEGIPAQARDAALGVGMTSPQRLLQVELPLAFPVILTGIRIVLVQNIGLVVIAALIGGGGLGVFIFQGISQTAPDLVLLGTLPVVAMAFTAAILLDALVDIVSGRFRGKA